MFTRTCLLLFAPLVAFAVTHDVNVGQHGLVFTPDTVYAAVGDKINFHYYPGHHGVAEGVFAKPCKPKKNGFWSGYIDSLAGPAKDMFTLTINHTNPIFVYCPTPDLHCQLGMTMAINPSEEQTLDGYRAGTKGTLSKTPKKVRGGTIGPNKAAKGPSRRSKGGDLESLSES